MPEARDVARSAGIDVGSSAVKVAVIDDRGNGDIRLLACDSERIRKRDPIQVTEEIFEKTLHRADLERTDLDYIATTGEGEQVAFRTGHFYGMTAHARGALFLEPEALAAIDIGALHTRAILMNERGKVLGYRMTSQCASGSGQFLENVARYLGIPLEDVGPLSCRGGQPQPVSSICAVLAETDVINMVSRGIATADILRGIHLSMAGRYVKLLRSLGVAGAVREIGERVVRELLVQVRVGGVGGGGLDQERIAVRLGAYHFLRANAAAGNRRNQQVDGRHGQCPGSGRRRRRARVRNEFWTADRGLGRGVHGRSFLSEPAALKLFTLCELPGHPARVATGWRRRHGSQAADPVGWPPGDP